LFLNDVILFCITVNYTNDTFAHVYIVFEKNNFVNNCAVEKKLR